jgi:molecular chaperone GrpE
MKKTKQKSTIKNTSNEQLEFQLKRTLADYQNLKKRIDSDKSNFIKFASASILSKLLSVLDDLERAEAHLKDQGLNLALDQFRSVLKTEGVEEINILNQVFDPQRADCVELIKGEKNKIINIIQKGYSLNGKVLRPAKVKVGQGG